VTTRHEPPHVSRHRLALLLTVLRRLAAAGEPLGAEPLPAIGEEDLLALVGPWHARYVRRAMQKAKAARIRREASY
jgi:hypothetical protein